MTNSQTTTLAGSSTAMDDRSSAAITAPSNLQVFLGFIQKFLDGDVDGALEFLHPDVVADEPESLPFGGEYRGREQFRVLMQKIHSTMKVEGEPPVVYDAGDAAWPPSDPMAPRAVGAAARSRPARAR